MLTESQLWQKVRQKEGSLVYTCIRRLENRILCVTDNAVEIENRTSKPYRTEIYSLYQQVHEMGEVFAADAKRWTLAVTYAILIEAVPDEIEAIPGKRLGIRLRRNSTRT